MGDKKMSAHSFSCHPSSYLFWFGFNGFPSASGCVSLARTQNAELLHTLQAGFNYLQDAKDWSRNPLSFPLLRLRVFA